MSKSRDIADSAATINYIDGLTSDAQTQIDTKAPLATPTFTGTVTATAFSGDGSGLTGVDSLPSQTGNNGLFLTTDGTDASWAEAGGGAWTLIETLSPSAASTIDVESLSSSYDVFKIVCRLEPSTASVPRIQVKMGGAYQSTNKYDYVGVQFSSNNGSTYIVTDGIGNPYMQIAGNTTDTIHYLEIYTNTSNETGDYQNIYYEFRANKSNSAIRIIGSGRWNDSTTGIGALQGIRFSSNSGTYTGKVYVYGLTATGA